jgi:centriolin
MKMFQRLQKERESEEKKLEDSKVTLKEQQEQLEKELIDQKSKLDQVLTQVSEAEERVKTLQEKERNGETLEKTLSQASMYSGTASGAGQGWEWWLCWTVS